MTWSQSGRSQNWQIWAQQIYKQKSGQINIQNHWSDQKIHIQFHHRYPSFEGFNQL